MDEQSLEIDLKCEYCHERVKAELRARDPQGPTLYIEPCTTCLNEAHRDGRRDADEAKYHEGYEACEEKYKEDIRAAVKLTQDVCAESKDGGTKALDSSS